MNGPVKAKKSPRNQPPKFDETLSSALPARPIPVAGPRDPLSRVRLALGIVWISAALLAGIGIGRLINELNSAVLTSTAPTPISEELVSVTSAAALKTAAIEPAVPAQAPDLTVQPAADVTQAAAGNIFATSSSSLLQPSGGSDALRPGFSHFGHSQGNIGTASIR